MRTGSSSEPRQRLVGYQRVELKAGTSQRVKLTIDPRLLADWNGDGWTIAAGDYRFAIGENAESLGQSVSVRMKTRGWKD